MGARRNWTTLLRESIQGLNASVWQAAVAGLGFLVYMPANDEFRRAAELLP
jgi:hypothetical protein